MTRPSKATSTPDARQPRAPAPVRYEFFGGKGGVGKTTCAAARALAAARAGRRTLLFSTDPAPSIGDALGQPLTSAARRIRRASGHLEAIELDASGALERWLADRRPLLQTLMLRGTWLDEEDVAALLRLSLPGIDEVAALIELGRHGSSGRYDLIVADTAPTGHTLRMLAMPALLRTIAGVFDRMQEKHRRMVEALRGRWSPEAEDALIASLDREGRELSLLLRDPSRATVTWVTLPEPLTTEETLDGLRALRGLQMHVDRLVINRLTPRPRVRCRWCTSRRRFEERSIAALRGQIAEDVAIAAISARSREPRGVRALLQIAGEMKRRVALRPRRQVPVTAATASFPVRALPASSFGGEQCSLLMFGGKGGVGKTTCAAAVAVELAERRSMLDVRVLSVDPAHSLGDVLGVTLDDTPRQVAGAPANLTAWEVDAAARFARFTDAYARAIDSLFDRIAGRSALDMTHDRNAMRDLLALAPPGLDELMAVVEVSDTLQSAKSTGRIIVVVDTAPTGHALRLLEMPAVVHDWVKTLMKILLKYQPVVALGDLGAVLLGMSQGLGRLRALLQDPARAAFIVITRPGMLPVAETLRLSRRLRSLGMHAPAFVVNAVGAGTCHYCAAVRRAQTAAMATLRGSLQTAHPPLLVVTPAVVPPPQAPRRLARWRATWTMSPQPTRRRRGR